MSTVAQEITRLRQAKADIRTAIEGKGVSVPEDVLIDTYDSYIEQIPQGGAVQEKQFNFYDYDGLLLYSFTYDEIQSMVELPALPTTTRDEDYDQYYTAHGWTHTLDELKAYDDDAWVDVGALYESSADRNYFYITVPRDNYKVYFGYMGTVNWGDGNSQNYPSAMPQSNYHTYEHAGDYIIEAYGDIRASSQYQSVYYPLFVGEEDCATPQVINTILKKVIIKKKGWVSGYGLNGYLGESLIVPYDITIFTQPWVRANNLKCLILNNVNPSDLYGSTCPMVETLIITLTPTNYDLEYKRDMSLLKTFTMPLNAKTLRNWMFANDVSLEHVTLSKGINTMSAYAFNGCYNLKSVSMMCDELLSIGESAFSSCYKLKRIEIPSTVRSISSSAFTGCYSLESISIPEGFTTFKNYTFQNCFSLNEVHLPSSLTDLGNYTFQSCRALKNIEIPDGVSKLGSYVFDGCQALESVELPSSISSIEPYAFQNCYSLKEVKMNSPITSIGNYAFYNCNKLQGLTIPPSVTSIGENAFYNCRTAFDDITIPKGITRLDGKVFYGCYSLKSVRFEGATDETEGISTIKQQTFYDCQNLKKVVIESPSTEIIKPFTIEANAFYNCYSLYEFHIGYEEPPTLSSTSAFYNCPFTKTAPTGRIQGYIYVPYSEDHHILNAYKSASNWSTWANWILEEPAE